MLRKQELHKENRVGILLSVALMVLGIVSLGTGIAAANSVHYARLEDPVNNPLGVTAYNGGLKAATTAMTGAMLVLLALMYRSEYRLQVLQGYILPSQAFVDTPLLTQLLVEVVLILLHCPAGCYALWRIPTLPGIPVVYDADSLLSCFLMYRLKPLLFIIMHHLSGFQSDKALAITCRVTVRLDAETGMRYLMKKQAVPTAALLYLLAVMSLSYCVWVMERPVCIKTSASYTDFTASGLCNGSAAKDFGEYYSNALWAILITSLTVGYGDLVPATPLGRLIAIIAALSGICLIALLVNAVSSYSQLDEEEDRACELLELAERNSAKVKAAEALRRDFVRMWVGKHLLARGEKASSSDSSSSSGTEKSLSSKVARIAAPITAAHHRVRHIRPFIKSLAAWKEHKHTWLEAKRRQDTLHAIREDIRQLRVSSGLCFCAARTGRSQ